jgi:hypothetical protein
MASDYPREFAERRSIHVGEQLPQRRRAPQRSPFAGLRLGQGSSPQITPEKAPLGPAVQRFARAAAEILSARALGGQPLPHQSAALDVAGKALDMLRPEGARDLRSALLRDRSLVDEAAKGRTGKAIRAMVLEGEVRRDPSLRAERFVEDWQRLSRERGQRLNVGDDAGAGQISSSMAGMAHSLERDPQLESLLRQGTRQLGIDRSGGASLSHDLQEWLGISRSRGIGR